MRHIALLLVLGAQAAGCDRPTDSPALASESNSKAAATAIEHALDEEAEWSSVSLSRDASRMRSYLAAYADSAHREEAERLLSSWDFEALLASGNTEKILGFLEANPAHPRRSEAEAALETANWNFEIIGLADLATRSGTLLGPQPRLAVVLQIERLFDRALLHAVGQPAQDGKSGDQIFAELEAADREPAPEGAVFHQRVFSPGVLTISPESAAATTKAGSTVGVRAVLVAAQSAGVESQLVGGLLHENAEIDGKSVTIDTWGAWVAKYIRLEILRGSFVMTRREDALVGPPLVPMPESDATVVLRLSNHEEATARKLGEAPIEDGLALALLESGFAGSGFHLDGRLPGGFIGLVSLGVRFPPALEPAQAASERSTSQAAATVEPTTPVGLPAPPARAGARFEVEPGNRMTIALIFECSREEADSFQVAGRTWKLAELAEASTGSGSRSGGR